MKRYHKYTEQEKQYILDNLRNYNSYSEFCNVFNTVFSCNVDVTSIRDLCTKRLHYGINKNSGKYKTGHRLKSLPIGTIRKTSNGCTYIKVQDTASKFNGYCLPDWMPLQRKIYEDHYGCIPKDSFVCFLDCDSNNFSIENLYCINRRISIRMSQYGWWSTDRNITLAGIKCIELYLSIDYIERYE